MHTQSDHPPSHAPTNPITFLQHLASTTTRVLTIPCSAGSGRATLEFSKEEFAADALKLSGITLISFEVRLMATSCVSLRQLLHGY